jgi:hypothetical protein
MFLAWTVLNCLMVLVGLFLLGRYRDRARRATAVGIIALGGYGVVTLLGFARVEFGGRTFGPGSELYDVVSGLLVLGNVACVLLLVVGIVIDRRP